MSRLARTRDASYWHGQLTESHPDLVLEPAVRLRAAVTEAAAQSVPVGSLTRDGAAAAAAEFDALSRALDPDRVDPAQIPSDPIAATGHAADTAVASPPALSTSGDS